MSWKGVSTLKNQILYEMHIGSFTQEGTWQAAMQKIPYLAELGITLIEMMPIAEFDGQFGWGYDGLFLFAPYSKYGKPTDLMAFIDKAHQFNIGVLLDVVYNHFGPGLVLHKQFAPEFFHNYYTTNWGEALNFDGKGSKNVRQFFISNALYFIDYFQFDGLRFDATQDLHDDSEKPIVQEIAETIRGRFPQKQIVLIAENEPQQISLIENCQLNAMWNDDFHHSAMVALLGKREAYLSDYQGTPQELLSAIKYGFLYQGQYYSWQKQNRGSSSLHQDYSHFVIYLENHDQVANLFIGRRLSELAFPSLMRAMTALLILSPQTPLIFQGQEFNSTAPFHFFADHSGELKRAVWRGRREFHIQFPSFATSTESDFPDPASEETFRKCQLNWDAMNENTLFLYKSLIQLRKEDPVLANIKKIDGAVIDTHVLLIRYFSHDGADRLLICNFGKDFKFQSLAEPLFAPPNGREWNLLFSSEEFRFGGTGYYLIGQESEWILSAYSSFFLAPKVL